KTVAHARLVHRPKATKESRRINPHDPVILVLVVKTQRSYPTLHANAFELLSMQFASVHYAAASQCCTRSGDYSRLDLSSLASTRGKYKLNVEPWPSWLYTRMAPPLSSTKRCTWYSPSPLPSPAGFVVKNRWKMR